MEPAKTFIFGQIRGSLISTQVECSKREGEFDSLPNNLSVVLLTSNRLSLDFIQRKSFQIRVDIL